MHLKNRLQVDLANFSRVRRTEGLKSALRQSVRTLRNRAFGTYTVPAGPQPISTGPRSKCFSGPAWRDLARQNVFYGTPAEDANLTRHFLNIGDLNLPQCFRYRVQGLGEVLGAENYDYSHYQDLPRAIRLMQTATDVIFYRVPMGQEMVECLYEARRLGLKVWYDIDDPLFSIPNFVEYSNFAHFSDYEGQHFLDQAPNYLAAIAACDAAIVSTDGLATSLRKLTQRPVHIRRNFLDEETQNLANALAKMPSDAASDERLVVSVSSASRGRIGDVKAFLPALKAALEKEPRLELLFLGMFEKEIAERLSSDRVTFEPVADFSRYLNSLAKTDLHLILLSDDSFNSCKSAIRYLEASALSVPVIATPIGDLRTVPGEGTITHISTPNELNEELLKFAKNPDILRNQGERARDYVFKNWTYQGIENIFDPDLRQAWALGK